MRTHISRIANHVYVKSGLEAVKAYQEAFRLEVEGEPQLDDKGVLMYQELRLNGQLFMSVSDAEFLEIAGQHPHGIRPTMLNIIYFVKEEDLRRAFELLYKEGNPSTGLRTGENKEHDVASCDVVFVDKFGVHWHLCVLLDWDSPLIP